MPTACPTRRWQAGRNELRNRNPLTNTCPPLPKMLAISLPAVPGDGRRAYKAAKGNCYTIKIISYSNTP